MSMFNFWRGRSDPPTSTPSSSATEALSDGPRRQSEPSIAISTWPTDLTPRGVGNYFTTDPLSSAARPSFTSSGEHMPRNAGYQTSDAFQQTFLQSNTLSPPRKHSQSSSHILKNSGRAETATVNEPSFCGLHEARVSSARAKRSNLQRKLDIIDRMDIENHPSLQLMPSQQQIPTQEQIFPQPQLPFFAEEDGTIHAPINNNDPVDVSDPSRQAQNSTPQLVQQTITGPPDSDSSGNPRRIFRHSSAPPLSAGEFETPLNATQLGVRNKYNFAKMIPAAAPAHAQMIAHLQNWSLILSHVHDQDLKTQIITAISERMEKVWMEAMQNGHIPLNWDSDMKTQAQAGKTEIDIAEINITANKMTEAELSGKRGRLLQVQDKDKAKAKKKRAVSPSQEIVIDISNHKCSSKYSITAGELEEAGVSMDVINDRVAEQRLDEFDELLADVLEALDKDDLRENDWLGVLPRTHNNPKGRYLKLFCLWEIPKCQAELRTLNRVMRTFSQAAQIRNTQHRIDNEEMLMDQLRALASELDDMEADLENSDSVMEVVVSGPQETTDDDEDDSESDMEEVSEDQLREWHYGNLARDSETRAGTVPPTNMANSGGQVLDQERMSNDGELIEVQPRRRSAFSAPVNAVTGVKRLNESAASSSEPPSKRVKESLPLQLIDGASFDIKEEEELYATDRASPLTLIPEETFEILQEDANEPYDTVEVVSVSSAFETMPQESEDKARAYLQYVIRPAVNNLLVQRALPAIHDNVSWHEMCEALEAADVDISMYENLVDGLEQKLQAWNVPVIEENGTIEVADIEGFPTRQEIWNATPAEGLNPQQLQDLFRARVDFKDERWRALVLSVADFDRVSLRFFAKDGLTEQLRHRLVVRLKTRAGHNPEDFSSRTVNKTEGFRWRYMNASTVEQRGAMDEVVHEYVKETILRDKEAKELKLVKGLRYDHHGRYEILLDPRGHLHDSPEQPVLSHPLYSSVIHGIWDFRGNKKQDNTVPGFEWFYEGKDGEVLDKWIVRYEKDAETEDGFRKIVERQLDDMEAEDQIAGRHIPKAVVIRGGKFKKNDAKAEGGGKRIKLNVNNMVAGSGARQRELRALGVASVPAVTGARVMKAGARTARTTPGQTPKMKITAATTKKGLKGRKVKEEQQTIAMGRSRRATTKAPIYVETAGDSSDGEFVP